MTPWYCVHYSSVILTMSNIMVAKTINHCHMVQENDFCAAYPSVFKLPQKKLSHLAFWIVLFWKFITFNNLTIMPWIHGAAADCSTSQLWTYTITIFRTFLMRSIWSLPYCTPCHLATNILKHLHIPSNPVKTHSTVRTLIASFGFWQCRIALKITC